MNFRLELTVFHQWQVKVSTSVILSVIQQSFWKYQHLINKQTYSNALGIPSFRCVVLVSGNRRGSWLLTLTTHMTGRGRSSHLLITGQSGFTWPLPLYLLWHVSVEMFDNPSALNPSRNHLSLFTARRHRRDDLHFNRPTHWQSREEHSVCCAGFGRWEQNNNKINKKCNHCLGTFCN